MCLLIDFHHYIGKSVSSNCELFIDNGSSSGKIFLGRSVSGFNVSIDNLFRDLVALLSPNSLVKDGYSGSDFASWNGFGQVGGDGGKVVPLNFCDWGPDGSVLSYTSIPQSMQIFNLFVFWESDVEGVASSVSMWEFSREQA